jgi:hypothetical protein
MSKTARLTKLFIWVVASVAIGLDVYWATNGTPGDTISEITKAYSWKWASIPTAYGVITGHLFWPVFGEVRLKWERIMALWLLAIPIVVADIVDLYDVIPLIPLAIAIPLGRLLWPQSVPVSQPLIIWKK